MISRTEISSVVDSAKYLLQNIRDLEKSTSLTVMLLFVLYILDVSTAGPGMYGIYMVFICIGIALLVTFTFRWSMYRMVGPKIWSVYYLMLIVGVATYGFALFVSLVMTAAALCYNFAALAILQAFTVIAHGTVFGNLLNLCGAAEQMSCYSCTCHVYLYENSRKRS